MTHISIFAIDYYNLICGLNRLNRVKSLIDSAMILHLPAADFILRAIFTACDDHCCQVEPPEKGKYVGTYHGKYSN